jgi:hypothetical protein
MTQETTPPAKRPLPVAAIAGAVILVGLVGFALYRRSAAPPTGESAPAAEVTPGETTASGEQAAGGTAIRATPPVHLSPEAAVLAERYRCVCGCNDPLGLCTCNLPNGSDDMRLFLEDQAQQHRTPEEIDREMTARFGPEALLTNPAPPQTQPSHVMPGGAGRSRR